MAISHTDLGISDADTARRLLARARVIAPCLDALDGEPRLTAIAILKGAAAELPGVGSRRAKSLSRDGTAITFDESAMFSSDDVASLRSLCTASSSGLAEGSFPVDRMFERLWPEERYS